MEEFTMPSAAEAEELTIISKKSKLEEEKIRELEDIKKHISYSIQQGYFSCDLTTFITSYAKEYLENLGYKIYVDEETSLPIKTVISWEPDSIKA